MPQVILTAIGSDRPGLVDDVSEFIFDRGGNIEDSRMVNLAGHFAVMILVGGTDQAIAKLRQDLAELSAKTSLRSELHEPAARGAMPGPALAFRLTGTALDQPGLVHRMSHLLRGLHVNIESLETHLRPAPYTGAPMFDIEFILSVPRTTPLSQLRQDIAKLCDELNVDWNLDPA